MHSGRRITLRGEGDEHRLATVFSALKERGCSILVAGHVPITTSQTVCRRLFGHPEERRERVLVRFQQTPSLEGWFPGGVGLDDRRTHVIDWIDPSRSVADDDPGFSGWRWESKDDPAETPALSRRTDIEGCIDEIDSIVADAGTLTPSQLRVGVFSFSVFDGPAEMIDVVSTVSPAVTAYQGMVHYHLEKQPTSAAAQALLDHVDAMLTVRKDAAGEPPAHKWTVTGYGETPWLPLRRYE